MLFPETFLGTMLKDSNSSLVTYENGNEIFLDRNGRAFHYILEYYRTGKLLWREQVSSGCPNMITREEIEAEIDYFQKIPALSTETTSNWLLDRHPDVYLYGSLVEAQPYLHNDKRVVLWKALFTEAVEQLISEDHKKRWGGSQMRVRPAMTVV